MENKEQSTLDNKSRRSVMAGAAAVAALGVFNPALAVEKEHEKHQANPDVKNLIDTAQQCEVTGDACLAHIFKTFTTGDTTLAKCGILVDDAIAACAAIAKLASNNSAHTKAMAAVCKSVCADCEVECRKHGKKHAICEDMANSCQATVKACEKVIG
ncbi:MAG: Csp1 family four helix bundle copper storage protein [Gammaproteobacteria bacterium]|nr:Csp1 family four helix bundle copper storage protein [Gammaproteobacteria bacterium]